MNASTKGRDAAVRSGARYRSQRGSALLLTMILAVVMATVLGGIFSYISTTSKAERRSNTRLESTYAAEYAFELAYEQLGGIIGQNSVNLPDASKTSSVTNLTTAPTSLFGAADGYSWQAFITVPVEGGVPIGAHSDFNPNQGIYRFMTVVEFTRKTPMMDTPVHMQFQREWAYTISPLFQYAIFYDRDMELFPGAAFNVTGRVHSNGRIYTGTSASISFGDIVTYVNGVTYGYSPLDPRSQPSLNRPSYAQNPVATARQNPPFAMGTDTTDSNSNNDGPHELIEVPVAAQTDPNNTERMYNKAGLKVVVNTTTSAKAGDNGVTIPANSQVFLTADGTTIPAGDPLANYLATLVTTGTTTANQIYDYREKALFTTTNVNVGALATAQDAGGLPQTIPSSANWPNNASVPAALKNQPIPTALQGKSLWNGILYVADITNSSTHRTGVKLVNGTTLPDGTNAGSPIPGLTVATPNAAYIVGNYNTGGNPPVNSGALGASNVVSGYTSQPAAVVADAVTVLSSNWSDSYKSTTALGSRPAAWTTVNTALVSGIVPSDGKNYSGGVENYIRLLEDWSSGRRLTYYGSMNNVYLSQQSTAPWGSSNVYNAASRNWYFDTNFLNPNKLPPGTPVIRTLRRGQWVQIE